MSQIAVGLAIIAVLGLFITLILLVIWGGFLERRIVSQCKRIAALEKAIGPGLAQQVRSSDQAQSAGPGDGQDWAETLFPGEPDRAKAARDYYNRMAPTPFRNPRP